MRLPYDSLIQLSRFLSTQPREGDMVELTLDDGTLKQFRFAWMISNVEQNVCAGHIVGEDRYGPKPALIDLDTGVITEL